MIVLCNPHAGDKLAEEYLINHVLPQLSSDCEVIRTQYAGHAEVIGRSLGLAHISGHFDICLMGGG